MRLGLWVAGVLGLIYLLTHALPMAPLLADLLDRLAMLGLVAMVFPALALRDLVAQTPKDVPSTRSRALRFLAPLSRVLPVFVVVTGVIGLVGFGNLAWEMTGYFLWLLLIGLALYFAAGLFADLKARSSVRLDQIDPQRAVFWRTHFLDPGHRLALLGAFAGGGWMLFWLWGWNAQTPAARWAKGLVDTVLFRVGEAPFTIGNLVTSVVLVVAVLWIGGWSQQVSYQLAYRKIRDQGLRQALATFTQYVVIVAGVLLALRIIGFDLTTLTVFAASLGVGIGFGMQNIVNNFISGILLLAERPLRIGDYVSIGLHQGTVTQIGIRSLTVRTPDKQEVVIPNGSVISKEFTNWTRTDDTVRDVQYLTIPYESDRDQAIEIVQRVLAEQPDVLKDPAPGVFLDGYTEYGVKIRLQYCFRFVRGPGTFPTRSAVLLEIGRRFAEAGIEFAEWRPLPPLAPAQ
jgi:potassium efflux system protein